jgi:hypothetical protein
MATAVIPVAHVVLTTSAQALRTVSLAGGATQEILRSVVLGVIDGAEATVTIGIGSSAGTGFTPIVDTLVQPGVPWDWEPFLPLLTSTPDVVWAKASRASAVHARVGIVQQ